MEETTRVIRCTAVQQQYTHSPPPFSDKKGPCQKIADDAHSSTLFSSSQNHSTLLVVLVRRQHAHGLIARMDIDF